MIELRKIKECETNSMTKGKCPIQFYTSHNLGPISILPLTPYLPPYPWSCAFMWELVVSQYPIWSRLRDKIECYVPLIFKMIWELTCSSKGYPRAHSETGNFQKNMAAWSEEYFTAIYTTFYMFIMTRFDLKCATRTMHSIVGLNWSFQTVVLGYN